MLMCHSPRVSDRSNTDYNSEEDAEVIETNMLVRRRLSTGDR
jgi:hypothetical protein